MLGGRKKNYLIKQSLDVNNYIINNNEQTCNTYKQFILKSILSEGGDSVLVDSFAELAVAVQDFHGGTMKNAETQLLNLFEKHNKAENQEKRNTNFMIIQQVTKGGVFVGSNKIKHMTTAMGHLKFDEGGVVGESYGPYYSFKGIK